MSSGFRKHVKKRIIYTLQARGRILHAALFTAKDLMNYYLKRNVLNDI